MQAQCDSCRPHPRTPALHEPSGKTATPDSFCRCNHRWSRRNCCFLSWPRKAWQGGEEEEKEIKVNIMPRPAFTPRPSDAGAAAWACLEFEDGKTIAVSPSNNPSHAPTAEAPKLPNA